MSSTWKVSSLNFKIHILNSSLLYLFHSYCILKMKAATHFEYPSSHISALYKEGRCSMELNTELMAAGLDLVIAIV